MWTGLHQLWNIAAAYRALIDIWAAGELTRIDCLSVCLSVCIGCLWWKFGDSDQLCSFLRCRLWQQNICSASTPPETRCNGQLINNIFCKISPVLYLTLAVWMHTELHWPVRVQYKLCVLMYQCQHNQAPQYLTDHCMPISDTVFCQRLRSASSRQVSIPRCRRSTYGLRFLLLVRRSGTHCPKTCGIRSVLWTVTDSH